MERMWQGFLTNKRSRTGARGWFCFAVAAALGLLIAVAASADAPPAGVPSRLAGSFSVKWEGRWTFGTPSRGNSGQESIRMTCTNVEMEWMGTANWDGADEYRVKGGAWQFSYAWENRVWESTRCSTLWRWAGNGAGKLHTEGAPANGDDLRDGQVGVLRWHRDRGEFELGLPGEDPVRLNGVEEDGCRGLSRSYVGGEKPRWYIKSKDIRTPNGTVIFDLNESRPRDERYIGGFPSTGWEATGQLVGTNAKGDVAIGVMSARMISSHELAVYTHRNFHQQTGWVTVHATINDRDYPVGPLERSDNVADDRDLAPIIVDLKKLGVPRFTRHQRITLTAQADVGGARSAGKPFEITLLLPVVIVPGILNGSGGDGSYDELERHLHDISGLRFGEDNAYALRSQNPAYPTIDTVAYDTTFERLDVASDLLRQMLINVHDRTYADKVDIVAHSKGAIVARQYLASDQTSADKVHKVIMTAPPNLGSTWADILPNLLPELEPVWPWHALRNESFRVDPPNPTLESLNRIPLPQGIDYRIIFSDSESTEETRRYFPPNPLLPGSQPTLIQTRGPGDSVVTAFSAQGILINPSDRTVPVRRIPAFERALQEGRLRFRTEPGSHLSIPVLRRGYLEQVNVMDVVVNELLQG